MSRAGDSLVVLRDLRTAAAECDRAALDSESGTKVSVSVSADAVVALVEIAEAARDYFAQSLPYPNDADADMAQENLRAALGRVHDERYA